MTFSYDPSILDRFPELVSGGLRIEGLEPSADASVEAERFLAIACTRLAVEAEASFPEVQAWRRAFARMGLKPTQVRCASEALLRRLRTHGSLPQLHPFVDLCNALSAASGLPVAAFDLNRVDGSLVVRLATGSEVFEALAGDMETPEPGEVIFADAAGRAHARRWTHRQSGWSAVTDRTSHALVVIEAMHAGGGRDVRHALAALAAAIRTIWPSTQVIEVAPR